MQQKNIDCCSYFVSLSLVTSQFIVSFNCIAAANLTVTSPRLLKNNELKNSKGKWLVEIKKKPKKSRRTIQLKIFYAVYHSLSAKCRAHLSAIRSDFNCGESGAVFLELRSALFELRASLFELRASLPETKMDW